MQRTKVSELRMGQKTEHYRIDEDAKVTEDGVQVKVTFHDGGSSVRIWDHPDIEIEVESPPQEDNHGTPTLE